MHGQLRVSYNRDHCGALIAIAMEGGGFEQLAMQLAAPIETVMGWIKEHPEFANAARLARTLAKAWQARQATVAKQPARRRARILRAATGSALRRAMPDDFPEVYVLLGCKETEIYYGSNGLAVQRWLDEFGAADLVQLRRGYLRKLAAAAGVPVATGRKPTVRGGGFTEARPNDPALGWMPVRRLRRPYREDVWVRIRGRPKPDLYEE